MAAQLEKLAEKVNIKKEEEDLETEKEERKEKIESFVAQFRAAKWYVEEADRRNDRF